MDLNPGGSDVYRLYVGLCNKKLIKWFDHTFFGECYRLHKIHLIRSGRGRP
jgi:hypothetical protein